MPNPEGPVNTIEALLQFLSDDAEEATTLLVRKRQALVMICRTAVHLLCANAAQPVDPEDAAHDTLLRVGELALRGGLYRGNVDAFFRQTAYHVVQERCRKQLRLVAHDGKDERSIESGVDDVSLECLSRCLDALDHETREMLRRYYEDDEPGERATLARDLGIGLGALRVRVHSARTRLRRCRDDCEEGRGVHV